MSVAKESRNFLRRLAVLFCLSPIISLVILGALILLFTEGPDWDYREQQLIARKYPLINAARKNESREAQRLLNKGTDVNQRYDHEGHTPLMVAACKGHVEAARLLVERGADINARTLGGHTALMYASMWGNVEIVRLLVEKGADLNVEVNGLYRTALAKAYNRGHTQVAEFLRAHGARK
jgi:uncharacterized protein